MKQPITITLLLLCSFLNYAQIRITGDDMPSVNDTLRLSETFLDSTSAAIYQQSGANVEWNFEHLRPIRQSVKKYERAINTPYGFFFLGFNRYGVLQLDSLGVGQFQFREVYQYFKSDSREFRVEGIGLKFQGVPLPAYYSDEDEIYQFPLEFEDRDSSTFAFGINLPALGSYESVGYRINEVDAWGSIKTPFGEFDCIRVVSDIVSTDSIGVAEFKIGIQNVRRSYKWLAKGVRVPILEIEGNFVAERFIPTRVRYRDNYRDINDVVENLAPSVAFEADNLTPNVGDTVRLISNSSDLTLHEWTINPSTFSYVENTTANSRNPIVIFEEAGDYDLSLMVTNTFGSADTTELAYITASPISSTRRISNRLEFEVFPNPATDELLLYLDDISIQKATINIYNQLGQLVQQAAGVNQLNVSELVEGIYFIEVTLGTWKNIRSFIINR
ncbi:MAG: T9SS type A sorting domain-containing protein [Bacteroidota bacterium]